MERATKWIRWFFFVWVLLGNIPLLLTKKQEIWVAYQNLKAEIFLHNFLFLMLIVLPLGYLFWKIPFLRWSWWRLVAPKGTKEYAEGGSLLAPTRNFVIPGLVLLGILFLVLPCLARLEEEWFRLGTTSWGNGLARSIIFGLAHLIIGIPLWATAVLGLTGLWYTYLYFQGGVALSTAYHFQMNVMLFSVVFFLVLLLYASALGSVVIRRLRR